MATKTEIVESDRGNGILEDYRMETSSGSIQPGKEQHMKIVIAFIAGMAFMFLITYITAKLVLWDDSVDFYGDDEE